MTFRNNNGECVTAVTSDGMLIIHSSPVALSWIPRDLINDSFEESRVGDYVEFEKNFGSAEVHTPEIDGHKVIRHNIRWK